MKIIFSYFFTFSILPGILFSQEFGDVSWGISMEEISNKDFAGPHMGDKMKLFTFQQSEEFGMGKYKTLDVEHYLSFAMSIVRYHFLDDKLVAINYNYQPYESESEIDQALWAKMVYDHVNTLIKSSHGKPEEKDIHESYLYSYHTYWNDKKTHVKNSFGYKDPYCYTAFQSQKFRSKYVEEQKKALYSR